MNAFVYILITFGSEEKKALSLVFVNFIYLAWELLANIIYLT